ncbi:DUF4372 domain-containing protein [Capnocytophaga canis]|uniref:DUF4372 domain-containing protein n=1 Tax=Capnocytophaga canis TaxID=1848903 RepID=UPI002175155B|nr:DUF4372 domain-containing protein [Capnocytophaga canis]
MALLRRGKNTNKPVIRQILDLIPTHILRAEIAKHQSDKENLPIKLAINRWH